MALSGQFSRTVLQPFQGNAARSSLRQTRVSVVRAAAGAEKADQMAERVATAVQRSLLGVAAAALVALPPAVAPDALAPAAHAGLTAGDPITNAKALLRNALPINCKPIRKVQTGLESISEALRIPGSKSLGPIGRSVRNASSVLDRDGDKIVAALAPQKKEAGLAAIAGLKQSLAEFQTLIDAGDKQEVPIKQQECLDFVSTIEEAMLTGFPFEVPAQYANLPQLKGRATVEFKIKYGAPREDNSTGTTMVAVLDGYNAPVTAGDVMDLIQKGFYNGMEIQRADGFVVQTGRPTGDLEGYVENGEVRRIPFEVMVVGDKVPVYEETLEDNGRFNETTALPFNAFGTMALARAEFEANSGSSQFFWLLKESELTPTGSNLLDGRYATFGYVIEGAPSLKDMQVGDKIESARILDGAENLVLPKAS